MAIRIDRSGQLWCRGPGLMLGYYKQPQSTAGRLVDGWLATGDRARQLPDGSLVILGRCDEVQCLGNGYKFDPWPLEQRLQRCLSEGHVILFGSSRNHRPIAAVSTPDESFDDNALLAQFASELDDRPVWERPGTIARLPYPLKIETGELTAKGSVVRAAIARLLPSVSIQRRE
jgi:long-subunit acyl-CoA synthetase (AMP-forming)